MFGIIELVTENEFHRRICDSRFLATLLSAVDSLLGISGFLLSYMIGNEWTSIPYITLVLQGLHLAEQIGEENVRVYFFAQSKWFKVSSSFVMSICHLKVGQG